MELIEKTHPNGTRVRVIADSISIENDRLTTLEVRLPRIVLAELNTHRDFSRNSASSRAIPVLKQIRKVLDDPFVPDQFGSARAGMQSGPPLEGEEHRHAEQAWLEARDMAVASALSLLYGFPVDPAIIQDSTSETVVCMFDDVTPLVHKEYVNRLLEPFMWHTVLITATDWENFFTLRTHPDAQREIRLAAVAMREALEASTPRDVGPWGWHLPYLRDGEDDPRISASRSATVSYERQDEVGDAEKELSRYKRLAAAGHMSPLEHPAMASPGRHANFTGWKQLRTMVEEAAQPTPRS